ncbi:MAG TPA: asparagine synthase (glutamine-hydrolyzing) [Verrucomicrobiae bacterium]|nr:asparagine synthase (glutamine-hydrolyzing) [Verrucomicrobiae bacterium]
MCGIAGMQLKPPHKAGEEALKQMGMLQKHRGPDHFGFVLKGNLGFAHNRLSIVDPSPAGHQPFSDGRRVLVYNGEIYNHQDLRKELSAKGIVFKSGSDTESLFHALVHLGVEETLRKISGMYAFAFADLDGDVVYLCRDRYGIKPLLWLENEKGIYWASEAKAFKPVAPLEVEPVRTFFSASGLGDQSGEYTVFKGVRQVQPGTYLVCKGGKRAETRRYHDLRQEIDPHYHAELDSMPFEKVQGLFGGLVENSVRRMLMSDVPMGSFVSGGVDSSLIAFWAAKLDAPHTLFTANVVGAYSEYEDAKMLAAFLGKKLEAFEFRPEMMLSGWASCTYHYECPMVTHINAIPFAKVAELASRAGVKAVLTGEGSDELFWGYPHLHWGRWKKALRFPLELSKKLYGIVPGLSNRVYDEMHSIHPFLERTARAFEPVLTRGAAQDAYSFLPAGQRQAYAQSLEMMKHGLLSLLHRNDRMGMSSGIESRFPYLDDALVRFALNLPARFRRGFSLKALDIKHPFMMDKKILRLEAARRVPARLAFKRKMGFPMYGHRHLRVKPAFFKGGFLEELLGLSAPALELMCAGEPADFLSKTVSVEIFGRIFAAEQSPEAVTQSLVENASLQY